MNFTACMGQPFWTPSVGMHKHETGCLSVTRVTVTVDRSIACACYSSPNEDNLPCACPLSLWNQPGNQSTNQHQHNSGKWRCTHSKWRTAQGTWAQRWKEETQSMRPLHTWMASCCHTDQWDRLIILNRAHQKVSKVLVISSETYKFAV